MATYNSVVINAPADQVWASLRNFNDMSWAEGIVESVESVNGKGGTEVGASRLVNGDEGPDVLASDMVEGYIGKARVTPITASGQSFVEWSSDWNAAKGDVKSFCDPLYAGLLGLLAKKFH